MSELQDALTQLHRDVAATREKKRRQARGGYDRSRSVVFQSSVWVTSSYWATTSGKETSWLCIDAAPAKLSAWSVITSRRRSSWSSRLPSLCTTPVASKCIAKAGAMLHKTSSTILRTETKANGKSVQVFWLDLDDEEVTWEPVMSPMKTSLWKSVSG